MVHPDKELDDAPGDQELLLHQLARNADYWEKQALSRKSPRSIASCRRHRDQCLLLADQIKAELVRSARGDAAEAQV